MKVTTYLLTLHVEGVLEVLRVVPGGSRNVPVTPRLAWMVIDWSLARLLGFPATQAAKIIIRGQVWGKCRMITRRVVPIGFLLQLRLYRVEWGNGSVPARHFGISYSEIGLLLWWHVLAGQRFDGEISAHVIAECVAPSSHHRLRAVLATIIILMELPHTNKRWTIYGIKI